MFRAKLLGIVLVAGLVSLGLVVFQSADVFVAYAAELQGDANTLVLLHFNETEGAVCEDASTYNNDGRLDKNGAVTYFGDVTSTGVRVAGKYGGGIKYVVPSSPYSGSCAVYINRTGGPTISDAFTIEMWLKGQPTGGYQGLFYLIPYLNHIGLEASGKLSIGGLRHGTWGGTEEYVYIDPAPDAPSVLDGNWHHVAVTFDKNLASDNYKIYIDGELIQSRNETLPLSQVLGQVPTSILLAERVFGPDAFRGEMDEFRVSNVARTAEQIASSADYFEGMGLSDKFNVLLGAIGDLKNNVDTIKGDITDLDTDLTTAEGDIDALEAWKAIANLHIDSINAGRIDAIEDALAEPGASGISRYGK